MSGIDDLVGLALDMAVARAEGAEPADLQGPPWNVDAKGQVYGVRSCHIGLKPFRPSTMWADGGPIIAREGISIKKTLHGWHARTSDPKRPVIEAKADTALVAAMRCYLLSLER